MTHPSGTESRMGRNAFSTVASAGFGIGASVVLDAIVVALFGMGWQTDAYYIANTIPMAMITLVMLQATRVVQPALIGKRNLGSISGWNYLNLVITSGTVIVSVFCLAGMFLSPMLMRLQSGAAAHDEVELATRLSIFFFSILPLYFPIVVMRAALNSFGSFALPGGMKFFENIFKIFFVLLFWRKLGVFALGLGMLAGALWQIGVFYFVLRRKGFRFQPILRLKHPDMIQAYNLVGFQLSGQLVGSGVDVVNNWLGSMLGAGNVTALRLASRIIESFAGLLPASVILAAMPDVASSVARGDVGATKRHLQRALYLLLLVSVPLSVWLALINRPLIAFLYQRASFSSADTNLVSRLLLLMVPYIFLGRLRSLFELPFFAGQNTWIPVLGSVTEAVVYVTGSLFLVSHLGIHALPVARTLGGIVGSCFLVYLLRRRMGNLSLGTVRESTKKIFGASLIMGFVVFLGEWIASAIRVQGFANQVIALCLPTGLGFVAIIASFYALRVLDASLLDECVSFLRRLLSPLMVSVRYVLRLP